MHISPRAAATLTLRVAVLGAIAGLSYAEIDQPSTAAVRHTPAAAAPAIKSTEVGTASPTVPASAPSTHAPAATERISREPVRQSAPSQLVIRDPNGKLILQAPIDPMAAPVNPDGSWGAIKPPTLDRAVWQSQSAAPGSRSPGTTAVYGHACLGKVCVFNDLVHTTAGSTITVETQTGELTYRTKAATQYPKSGAHSLASKPSLPNELMLVTCAYRPDESSVDNLVVIGELIASRPK